MRQIILASTSPRRKEILSKLGIDFKVVASDYEEDMNLRLKPTELAKYLSRGKAESVMSKHPNSIVIGADTFLVLDNEVLGKPLSVEKMRIMLKKISGQVLYVITGVTVLDTRTQKNISQAQKTKVFMKKLTDYEIKKYIENGEGLDRAGGIAIQGLGAIFVKKIEGDYQNLLGLPLFKLTETLTKFGIKII